MVSYVLLLALLSLVVPPWVRISADRAILFRPLLFEVAGLFILLLILSAIGSHDLVTGLAGFCPPRWESPPGCSPCWEVRPIVSTSPFLGFA